MSATGQKVLIYEQTVQNILKLVKERNLTTGDKLPSETELAALLGSNAALCPGSPSDPGRQ